MKDDLFIGFDEELGGQVIRSSDGSFILFKGGNIFAKAQKEVYLNIDPATVESN